MLLMSFKEIIDLNCEVNLPSLHTLRLKVNQIW